MADEVVVTVALRLRPSRSRTMRELPASIRSSSSSSMLSGRGGRGGGGPGRFVNRTVNGGEDGGEKAG